MRPAEDMTVVRRQIRQGRPRLCGRSLQEQHARIGTDLTQGQPMRLDRAAAAGSLNAEVRIHVIRMRARQLDLHAVGGEVELFGHERGQARCHPLPHFRPRTEEAHHAVGRELKKGIRDPVTVEARKGQAWFAATRKQEPDDKAASGHGSAAQECPAGQIRSIHACVSPAIASVASAFALARIASLMRG